ncbi:hypothetical protein [Thalassotalea sp. PLHSN55]|uniref:hypothetical protein n=1 Tax=Thalassotalea sp. PLHSN55 TaxID=3435888 RepID=UPI003F874CC0
MNEPLVLIFKLDELALLASTNNAFEKAAIYGATQAIKQEFVNSKLNTRGC